MGRFGLVSTDQENRMKRILMAGAVVLAAATQAFAADLPPPMAPPPRAPAAYVPVMSPAYNWSGFYVGLNAGYGFGSSTWTPLTSGNFAVDGPMAGGTLGANYQFGQIVIGAEGDIDWQGLRGSSNTAPCFGIPGGCDTASNWVATFRGRLGYAFDRVLVYGTAGGAAANVEASSAALPWSTGTELGWSAGAGIEAAMTDNWTAKIEYLFADFAKVTCPAGTCTTAPSGSQAVSLYENMIRVGVNYKFGY
jgi:outer membrane immunogenic protein